MGDSTSNPLEIGEMAASLYSRLSDDVNLPHDLLPDDTKLIYDGKSGKVVDEFDYDDPDDVAAANGKRIKHFEGLALAHYNDKNHTDYKLVTSPDSRWCFHEKIGQDKWIIHCGFTAAPNTALDYESTAKYFLAEFEANCSGAAEVLTSCRIVNGRKTTGCDSCDRSMCRSYDAMEQDMKAEAEADCMESAESVEDEASQILSQYSHLLAEGVTLSERAMLRLPYPFLALKYYNKKHGKNYKLVDALPMCGSIDPFMVHCNFIARQSELGEASNKLFFAELHRKGEDRWVVSACRLLHGCKTVAGCHACETPRQGKRVVHPTYGFRFGRYPYTGGNQTLRPRCR